MLFSHMTITPYGAAGQVTGSAYLVETAYARVLVDFGMFQGGRELEAMNILPEELQPGDIDAVVLTHGHLDHCGRLPMLLRCGYHGAIHATPATIEMAELILLDSARIQTADYERKQRKAKAKHRGLSRDDEPLYDEKDVHRAIEAMKPASYETWFEIATGVTVRFHDSGHMLGSASISMIVTGDSDTKHIVFSGDIGPRGAAYLQDPTIPPPADVVVMESTYGDRDHRPLRETVEQFSAIIDQAVDTGGKILIPSFAVGRTQQILYHIAELIRDGRIPHIPIYIDSPMAIEATRIYEHHPELFDNESTSLIRSGELRRNLSSVRTAASREESQAINDVKGACIVIAGSGMCTAGRILHHLRQNLDDPTAHVVIVGYQSYGSLGRRLVDGQDIVSVLGDKIRVRAAVHTLSGFSAHAGQQELLDWVAGLQPTAQTRIMLTHGEDDARHTLAGLIKERHGIAPTLPSYGEHLEL